MKIVLIVLTIAVAASAKPVNRKWEEIRDLVHGMGGNVDDTVVSVKKWDEIKELAYYIQLTLGFSIFEVVEVATAANAEVGQQIIVYLQEKIPEIDAIYKKIDDEIEAQTLSYNQAVTYFTQFENVLNKVHDGLTNFVSELPQGAQNEIKNMLETSNRQIKQFVDEILTLLRY